MQNNQAEPIECYLSICKRDLSIDILESIAIILVVFYHSMVYSDDFISNTGILYYIRYALRSLLSPCVALFFFCNGYLLLNKPFNLKKHILKTIKLIILTVIWAILRIIILMPIKKEYLSVAEAINVLLECKQGWINSIWFLGALICIYVLFPIIKVTYDSNKRVFFYFIICCSIFTFGNVVINEVATFSINLVLQKNIIIHGLNFFSMFNPFRGIHGYAFVYFCLGGGCIWI